MGALPTEQEIVTASVKQITPITKTPQNATVRLQVYKLSLL
jgi:hypothetical protein